MAEGPVIVLADDLTGACEIAAIGLSNGLRSVVSMNLEQLDLQADLLVYDTETRLDSPAFARAKLNSTLELLRGPQRPSRFYKKVDSVLRGPIVAELNLLADSLQFPRVILVPANPALGRTIQNGFYRINGQPLHETPFAHDLHHPATSSWVVNLLGNSSRLPIHRSSLQEELPVTGLVVGDVSKEEDFAGWASRLGTDTLPAGAAAFFKVLLPYWLGQAQKLPVTTDDSELPVTTEKLPVTTVGAAEKLPVTTVGAELPVTRDFVPASPTLLISGTTAPGQVRLLEERQREAGDGVPIDFQMLENRFPEALNRVAESLEKHSRALVYMGDYRKADSRNAYKVRTALARLASYFVKSKSIGHLVVEGGATAAAIANEMDCRVLEALHEWAPGVVSLRPTRCGDIILTMKPGSYPWPERILPHLFPEKSP